MGRWIAALLLSLFVCASSASAGVVTDYVHHHYMELAQRQNPLPPLLPTSYSAGAGTSQTFSFIRGTINATDGGAAFYNLATGTGAVSGDQYAGSASTYTPSGTNYNSNPGLGSGQCWGLSGGICTPNLRPWSAVTYLGSPWHPAGIEKDVGFYLNPNSVPDYSGSGAVNPLGLTACTPANNALGYYPCLVDMWDAPIASTSSQVWHGVSIPANLCYPSGCNGILPANCSKLTVSQTSGTATFNELELNCSTNTHADNFVGINQMSASACSVITNCVAVSSGTYNPSTGLVSLTLSSSAYLAVGAPVTVIGATGTGSFASIDGTFQAAAGTTSTQANYTIATGLTMTITGFGGTSSAGVTAGDTPRILVGGTNAVTFDQFRTAYGPQPQASVDQQDGEAFITDTGGAHNFIMKDFEIDGLPPCIGPPTYGTCIDNYGRSYHFRQIAAISLKNTGSGSGNLAYFYNGAMLHSEQRPFASPPSSTTTQPTLFQTVYVEGSCEQPYTGGYTTSSPAYPAVPYTIPPNYPVAGQWAAGNQHCEINEQSTTGGMFYNDVVVWTPRTSPAVWTAGIYCANGLTVNFNGNECQVDPAIIIGAVTTNYYGLQANTFCTANPTLCTYGLGMMAHTMSLGGGPFNTLDWENVFIDGTGVSGFCIYNAGFGVQNVNFSMASGSMTVSSIGLGVGFYPGLDAAGEQETFNFKIGSVSHTVNVLTGPAWPGGTGTYTVSGTFSQPSGTGGTTVPSPIITSALPTIQGAATPVSSVFSITSGSKVWLDDTSVVGCP